MDKHELIICLSHLLVLREHGEGSVARGSRHVAIAIIYACIVS